MKKVFSIILSVLFAVCLLCTLLLSVVRFNFSYSTIIKLAGELFRPVSAAPKPVDDGLFHPGDIVFSYAAYSEDEYDLSQFGDFDLSSLDFSSIDLANMDINAIVQSVLDANDIDVEAELVADILASPEVSNVVDKYADEIINYMTGATDELNVNPEDITALVNTAIDKYEVATGETVDRTGLEEAVSVSVEAAVPSITATLDTAKEENAETFEALKKVNILLSAKVFALAIAVCLILALVICLINMNIFVCFKYVSIPALVDGFILFVAAIVAGPLVPGILQGVIAEYGLPAALYNVIINYVAQLLGQLKIYGIITVLLGVVLCVFGFKLGKEKK
ncbi:MAG: hypothetical protein IJ688_11830 [Treponema sp.]|nr:hypothetical protein [Treponema sp.]